MLLRGKCSTVGIMALTKEDRVSSGIEERITPAPRLRISLLAEFLVEGQDGPISLKTSSYQALLAYLVTHAAQLHSRKSLALKFWPDSTEAQALTNLRKALHTVRHALPDGDCFLDVTRRTVQWRPDAPCSVDVWEFETAVTQSQQTNFTEEQQAFLEEAISAYQGDFLPGFYEDWVLAARETYRAHYLSALDRLLLLHEGERRYMEAITLAKKLLREDPLHEAAYRRLMRLQSLAGNVAGALRTYHTCSSHLKRELGVDPSPATQEAYERLLHVQAPPTPLAPTRLPLVAREEAWQTLQTAWKRGSRGKPGLVLLSGEAGIGKTRLAEEMLDWAERQGITLDQCISWTDGTKLQVEQALVANGLGATIAQDGLVGPADVGLQEGADILGARAAELAQPISDYLLSREAPPGVFIVATHEDDQKESLSTYKMGDGPYYVLVRPYHLAFFEIPKTISRVLEGKPPLLTNSSKPTISVAAVTKGIIPAGTIIQRGIGGFDVRGEAVKISENPDHVPIGLLSSAIVKHDMEPGHVVTFADVELPDSLALRAWSEIKKRAVKTPAPV